VLWGDGGYAWLTNTRTGATPSGCLLNRPGGCRVVGLSIRKRVRDYRSGARDLPRLGYLIVVCGRRLY